LEKKHLKSFEDNVDIKYIMVYHMVISMIFHGCVSKNARDPESIIFLSGTRPGKRSHNYGTSPFLKGKSTINCNFPVRKLFVDQRVISHWYPIESL
jgi:hypothetical protein